MSHRCSGWKLNAMEGWPHQKMGGPTDVSKSWYDTSLTILSSVMVDLDLLALVWDSSLESDFQAPR